MCILDPAWPLNHVFMLVVFALVVRAGRLRGWRRHAPLFCGLALPAFLVLRGAGAPPAVAAHAFPLLATSAFALLGLAVRRGE